MDTIAQRAGLSRRRKTVITVISKIGDRRPRADACLVVIYGDDMGHRFPIKQGELLIGRSSQAHLQIDHESVSRRHAKVVADGSVVTVTDMGSTNGTYINDEAVTESRELRDGDFIKVGRTILKYLSNNNIEAAYHEEIYRLTTVDGLTRCFNRRYLREQLVREVSRAIRYQRPLSVLTFDVDNFAQLNDDFGHLAGDAILTQLGKRIARRIRREDVFARTNGGEFAIIVPESDKDITAALGERIVQIVGEGAFGFDDVNIPVTISVGNASLSEINEDDGMFVEETQETTGDNSPAESYHTDTSEVASTTENDRFAMIAETLIASARRRMLRAKRKA